jgi:acyl-CoA hydrolase
MKNSKKPDPSKQQQKPVSASQVTMTELVLPQHTNALGTVFGGVVMSWIDICAAIAAQRHSQKVVVTASIDALYFVKPIYKGWIVNIRASVNRVFDTSMEVGVRLEAENPLTNQRFHTSTAYLTFVALDEKGKPHRVSQVIPETSEEKRRYEMAQARRENRLKLKRQRGTR